MKAWLCALIALLALLPSQCWAQPARLNAGEQVLLQVLSVGMGGQAAEFEGAPSAELALSCLAAAYDRSELRLSEFGVEHLPSDDRQPFEITPEGTKALYDSLFLEGEPALPEPGEAVGGLINKGSLWYEPGAPSVYALHVNRVRHRDGDLVADITVTRSAGADSLQVAYSAEVVLRPDAQSFFGARVAKVTPLPPPAMSRMKSSSVLDNDRSYAPSNALDGLPATCWSASRQRDAAPWIRLSAQEDQLVRGVALLPGYAKSASILEKNHRIEQLEITLSDGTSLTRSLTDMESPESWRVVFLDQPVRCRWIQLTVRSVYRGSRYDDVCISEIQVF